MVEYRGYGLSGGVPSEAGLERDGDAAMAWLAARPDVHQGKIFLYGQSLGGAVAIRTAVNHMHMVAGALLGERDGGGGCMGSGCLRRSRRPSHPRTPPPPPPPYPHATPRHAALLPHLHASPHARPPARPRAQA
jgi:fermentation-respiration switch protein FrsA (DUF1100 family)